MVPREPVTYSLITPLSVRLRTDIGITVQECPKLASALVPGAPRGHSQECGQASAPGLSWSSDNGQAASVCPWE